MEPQTTSEPDRVLLLEDVQSLCIKNYKIPQKSQGCEPLKRSLELHIQNGFINLDKPLSPTAHQVCKFVGDILRVKKRGHGGNFDSRVSGCLIVCLNNAARLAKWLQGRDKNYVVLIRLLDPLPNVIRLKEVCRSIVGPIFQRKKFADKDGQKMLQIQDLRKIDLIEYDVRSGLGLLRVDFQAEINIKTLCTHVGLLSGRFGVLMEARRIESGIMTEYDNLVTLHDVCDAQWLYDNDKDERHMRAIIMPLERLLIGLKRIMIMDSAVEAICYGAKLTAAGILRYSHGINIQDDVVIMTAKGEAVALGIALNTSVALHICTHGFVVKLKRVLMARGSYEKQWLITKEQKKARQAQQAANPVPYGPPIESYQIGQGYFSA